jgi:hypothetical protein
VEMTREGSHFTFAVVISNGWGVVLGINPLYSGFSLFSSLLNGDYRDPVWLALLRLGSQLVSSFMLLCRTVSLAFCCSKTFKLENLGC